MAIVLTNDEYPERHAFDLIHVCNEIFNFLFE